MDNAIPHVHSRNHDVKKLKSELLDERGRRKCAENEIMQLRNELRQVKDSLSVEELQKRENEWKTHIELVNSQVLQANIRDKNDRI